MLLCKWLKKKYKKKKTGDYLNIMVFLHIMNLDMFWLRPPLTFQVNEQVNKSMALFLSLDPVELSHAHKLYFAQKNINLSKLFHVRWTLTLILTHLLCLSHSPYISTLGHGVFLLLINGTDSSKLTTTINLSKSCVMVSWFLDIIFSPKFCSSKEKKNIYAIRPAAKCFYV